MTDESQIIYEDNHLIAVNKKASEIVQGDKTGDMPLTEKVKQYLKKKYNKPGEAYIGLIHRLDRPVSGLVLLAKTSKALSRMNKLFKEKDVEKKYWAIVGNNPVQEQGTLVHYLVRDSKKNKSFSHDKEVPNSKKGILHYKVLAHSDNYHLLEITLETGRHHQIRSQLSKIGSPIKGDLKYGAPRSNKDASISLHARKLIFKHPVKGEKIEIIADVPKDSLWDFFYDQLKK